MNDNASLYRSPPSSLIIEISHKEIICYGTKVKSVFN